MTHLTLAAVIITVFLTWSDTNTTEEGTVIYREIAGTFQPVGTVGPDVVRFDETFTATEGAQLCYYVRPFRGEELAPLSNEWCGQVPVMEPEPEPDPPPEPCARPKGKSGKCHK